MTRNSLRIIFQDVDGCLNPEDGEAFGVDPLWEPSARQIDMLRAIDLAVDASPLEHFVINTGRFEPILHHIVKHLHTPKLRFLVMEHACVILDRKTGTHLELATIARACGLDDLADRYANIATMRRLLSWYDIRGQAEMERHYGVPVPRLDKLANLSFAFPDEAHGAEVLDRIERLVRADFPNGEFAPFEFCRSDRFIDILPGIHKMDGIELVCAHLGIEKSQALAVGDFLNDLAVFEAFDQVMCPSNAHPDIRALTEAKGSAGHVSQAAYGASLIDFLNTMSP